MTLDEARAAIRSGAHYGDVYEHLGPADGAELAAWYVREPGVPNLAARQPTAAAPDPERPLREISGVPKHEAPVPVPTGDTCKRCGGLTVRTGTCLTCQSCGDSSGGCG